MYKLHRKYLLSKANYIIIFLIMFLTFVVYWILFNPLNYSNTHWLNKNESLKVSIDNIVFINKFIGVLVGSFLFGNSFSLQQDSYNVLFLRSRKDKINFYITKIISIMSIIAIIFLALSISNLLLVFYKISYFTNLFDLILINIESTLISFVYGSLAIVLIQLFKTQLVLLIPLLLFILSDTISSQYVRTYLPVLSNQISLSDLIHKIILFFCYTTIGGIIYYYKDL